LGLRDLGNLADRMNQTNILQRSAVPAAIEDWLDRAESDRRFNVLACGVPGMGKSHVATSLLEAARRRGFRTVLAGPSPAGLPYQLLAQLGSESPSAAVLESAHIFWLARLGLTEAEARGPVAVVFEDIDAYDVSDLAFVRDLAVSSTPTRMVVLLTCRCEAGDHPPTAPRPAYVDRFVEVFPRLPNCERWELEPLTLQEATEFITVRLGRSAAPRTVRELLELSEHNALYLDRLLDSVETLPGTDQAVFLCGSRGMDQLRLPDSLRSVVRVDSAGLDPDQLAVLETLAIWAMPAGVEVLRDLTELDSAVVADALEALERTGLVRPMGDSAELKFSLSSSLGGRLLAEEAPALRRRGVHMRASELLDRQVAELSPEGQVLAARHYLASGTPPSERGAAVVAAAARYLISRSRFDGARELLTNLVRQLELTSRAVPAESLLLLAETQSRAGAWGRAARALRAIADQEEHTGDRSMAVDATLRAARDLVARGEDAEALSFYHRLLEGDQLAPPLLTRVLSDQARVQLQIGQPEEAMRSLNQSAQVADDAGLPDASVDAHLTIGLALLDRGKPAMGLPQIWDAYLLARRAGRESSLARALAAIGGVVAAHTSVERGTRWLRRATRVAERCEDYATVSWTGARLVQAYIETGEWARARALIAALLEIDQGLHRTRSLRRLRALGRMLDTFQGRPSASSVTTGELKSSTDGFGGPGIYASYLAARFEQQIADAEYEAAGETIDTVCRLLRANPGSERPLAVDVLPRRALVLARLGDREGLVEVIEEMRRFADRFAGEVALTEPDLDSALARLALLDGRFDEAARLSASAAGAFIRSGYRWRGAIATKEAGRAALRAGANSLAVTQLQEAHRSFQIFGATVEMAQTRELLHQLGRRAPPVHREPSTLTARQSQVAELLSERLSDAQIADRLQISRRTVTTHVHNILQALQLHSRVDVQHWVEDARAKPPAPDPGEWVLTSSSERSDS
jgi:DNA-binding CsgD family transcriptional regulator